MVHNDHDLLSILFYQVVQSFLYTPHLPKITFSSTEDFFKIILDDIHIANNVNHLVLDFINIYTTFKSNFKLNFKKIFYFFIYRMNKEPKKDKNSEKWTKEQEELMAEWAEKAAGYRWLHSRSEKLYRKRNYTFTIPVIILSTLTGTANFAMDSFIPEENKQIAMACVGGVNIFAGILSTLQNFLRYAELMEGHRGSEVSWSKFNREISVELALNPKMRKPATDFLNVCRAEFDRLIEQSPTIDDSIIKQYKYTFKGVDINHPLVCNGLHKCKVYEPSEQEKTASIVANASEKLKKNSALHHFRGNLKHVKEMGDNQNTNGIRCKGGIDQNTSTVNIKNESMKELDSLKGIGKVSGLKSKINPQNTFVTHQEELKTLIIPDNSENMVISKKYESVIIDKVYNTGDNTGDNAVGDTVENTVKNAVENTNETVSSHIEENCGEKKNIKVSINIDDDGLKEGEYELFKGNLNKKDKKIDGDIFLIEKDTVTNTENIIKEDNIVTEITEPNDTDDTDTTEVNNNITEFLDEIK